MSTNQFNRQEAKYAVVELTPDNLSYTAKVPYGALLIAAGIQTHVAFDGTGAVTGNISDGSANIVSAEDLKTTGTEAVDTPQKYYPTGATFTIAVTDANSDSAAGQAIAFIGYVVVGTGECVYG